MREGEGKEDREGEGDGGGSSTLTFSSCCNRIQLLLPRKLGSIVTSRV